MKVILDDGGRKQIQPNEHRDCTVRAIAWATGKGYAWAHKELANAGRKPTHGFHLRFYLESKQWAKDLGDIRRQTYGRFAREHPKGNFIVRSRGHVAPIVDGVIIDLKDSSKCRLTSAWEINFREKKQNNRKAK